MIVHGIHGFSIDIQGYRWIMDGYPWFLNGSPWIRGLPMAVREFLAEMNGLSEGTGRESQQAVTNKPSRAATAELPVAPHWTLQRC